MRNFNYNHPYYNYYGSHYGGYGGYGGYGYGGYGGYGREYFGGKNKNMMILSTMAIVAIAIVIFIN